MPTVRKKAASGVDGRVIYKRGDVLDAPRTRRTIVAFLINDRAVAWGSGVARQAASRYPLAHREFRRIVAESPRKLCLGEVIVIRVGARTYLAAVVAQRGYGRSAVPRLRYAALEKSLRRLVTSAKKLDASVRMPRIGCGSAGGTWKRVLPLVAAAVVNKVRVYVVDRQWQANLARAAQIVTSAKPWPYTTRRRTRPRSGRTQPLSRIAIT